MRCLVFLIVCCLALRASCGALPAGVSLVWPPVKGSVPSLVFEGKARDFDCFRGCNNEIDRCQLAVDMEGCYDSPMSTHGRDFAIDVGELKWAYNTELHWWEKAAAKSPEKFIEIFDGADGSKKDGKIDIGEFMAVKIKNKDDPGGTASCGDLKDARKYLLNRCFARKRKGQ